MLRFEMQGFKGILSLSVCSKFIFFRVLTVIRYIEIYFTLELPDYFRYSEEFNISRFCYIHFTAILAELKNIVCYIEDFVKQRFVKSRFHCTSTEIQISFRGKVSRNAPKKNSTRETKRDRLSRTGNFGPGQMVHDVRES